MKQLVYIVILSFVIKPVFPLIDYAVNYKYIATVLCENKAKPELQCNGKCHLMKELAKAADTENTKSSDKKSFSPIQEVLFFKEIKTVAIVSCVCSKQAKNSSSYLNLYSYLNTNSEFHPPTFIS